MNILLKEFLLHGLQTIPKPKVCFLICACSSNWIHQWPIWFNCVVSYQLCCDNSANYEKKNSKEISKKYCPKLLRNHGPNMSQTKALIPLPDTIDLNELHQWQWRFQYLQTAMAITLDHCYAQHQYYLTGLFVILFGNMFWHPSSSACRHGSNYVNNYSHCQTSSKFVYTHYLFWIGDITLIIPGPMMSFGDLMVCCLLIFAVILILAINM